MLGEIENAMPAPQLSVVIPVYNEEGSLPELFARLYPALDALGVRYEVVFVNDGSRDRSAALLREQQQRRPDATTVVLFNANYGQHQAIVAGFERCTGERVVTMDADLQNPPEEIAKLLAAMDRGHDYVGGVRMTREDAWWRRWASKAMNRVRERLTHIRMTDQGCMLRAYSREIADAVAQSREVSTFIPALAYTFARAPTEVDVVHAERVAGSSHYPLYKLIRLNFDLITGFSLVPLQLFSEVFPAVVPNTRWDADSGQLIVFTTSAGSTPTRSGAARQSQTSFPSERRATSTAPTVGASRKSLAAAATSRSPRSR